MHAAVVPVVKWASRYVTVEPLMFIYYISTTVSMVVTQNLMLYKSCWPEAQPASMSEQCPDEEAAQAHVSGIAVWKPFLQYLLPAVGVAFAGTWSDRRGRRRPLLLVPLVGQLASDLCVAASVVLWSQWTPTLVAVAETVPAALGGARGVLSVGVVSYLSDVTTPAERTARMGALMACVFVGSPVGSALAGASNRGLGFLGSLLLCAALNSLALLYSALRLSEPAGLRPSPHAGSVCDGLKLLAQPRLLALVCSTLAIIGPMQGEYSVLYLFVRYKFGWTEVDYSLYGALRMIVICAGTVFTVLILCRYLKMRDALIGIISCSTQLIASLLYLVVSAGWQMYIVPLAEVMHGAAMAVQKSIGTKIVNPSDIGKLNALYSLSEAVVPVAIIPLYNVIYQQTFSHFSSAFFLTSTVITSPALLMFIWLYVESRRKDVNAKSKCLGTTDKKSDQEETQGSAGLENNSQMRERRAADV